MQTIIVRVCVQMVKNASASLFCIGKPQQSPEIRRRQVDNCV